MKVKVRENGKVVRLYQRQENDEVEDALLEMEEEKQERERSLWEQILESEYGDGDFVEF